MRQMTEFPSSVTVANIATEDLRGRIHLPLEWEKQERYKESILEEVIPIFSYLG